VKLDWVILLDIGRRFIMRIIQISGKGRAGKTTTADLIAKYSFNLGYIPVMIPFAQAIKQEAAQKGITKELDSAKYREFCQELGASKRMEDPDYWVNKTYDLIQEYMLKEINNKNENKKYWEYVIIQDDVRYMNELALGRDLVATQLFVSHGSRALIEENAEWRKHESEVLGNAVETSNNQPNNEYDELFDVVVNNDGNLKDLETLIKESINELLSIGYLELESIDYYEETDPSDS
jgi:hypothetical protein